MRLFAAAMAVASVSLVLTAGLAGAGSARAPTPGELWSEFPLEPRTEPVRETPPPASTASRPDSTRLTDSSEWTPMLWLLLALGALTAATVALRFVRTRLSSAIPPGKHAERPRL